MKIEFGTGIFGLLTLLFAIAKIWHMIDWSWWLVFLPLIIGIGIWLIFGIVVLIIIILGAIYD